MSTIQGEVVKVSGPLVVARGLSGSRMYEMVRVGEAHLFGEIIEIRGDDTPSRSTRRPKASAPASPCSAPARALSVELGPGLIRSIYDGVQRPLDALQRDFGDFIVRGAERPALDRQSKWDFVPVAKAAMRSSAGDVLGTVQESKLVVHKIMVPAGVKGKIAKIGAGDRQRGHRSRRHRDRQRAACRSPWFSAGPCAKAAP